MNSIAAHIPGNRQPAPAVTAHSIFHRATPLLKRLGLVVAAVFVVAAFIALAFTSPLWALGVLLKRSTLGGRIQGATRGALKAAWRKVRAVFGHWLVQLWAASIAAIYGAYHVEWMSDVSSFSFALGKISLLLSVAWLISGRRFDGVNSITVLKKNPTAYAMVTATLIASAVYIICNS